MSARLETDPLTSVLQSCMPNLLRTLLTFLSLVTLLCAQSFPTLFAQLGTPLYEQSQNFQSLLDTHALPKMEQNLKRYLHESNATRQAGLILDEASPPPKIQAYLKGLRQLQRLHDTVQKHYKHALYESIHTKDLKRFSTLLQTPLPFIEHDARLKKSVVEFAALNPQTQTPYLKSLHKDFQLDERSYAYVDQMFQPHQKNQAVESRQRLDSFEALDNLDNPIRVFSVRTKNGFDLFLENHAYYDVSVQLHPKTLINMQADKPLPHTQSFSARSRHKFLTFSIIDPSKPSRFSTSYNTLIGRISSRYDKNYIYALPFQRGTRQLLTQGFKGAATHKGKSAYALDFAMPIGTPVHAMRDGIVVATESKHTEHGFSPAFANKSNYVIIQHEDGTMAMYGHLNTNGVKVRLGDRVYKHSHIAYSGKKYSSGPHLHVHITNNQSFQSGGSSIPFQFKSEEGIVSQPIEKRYYQAN